MLVQGVQYLIIVKKPPVTPKANPIGYVGKEKSRWELGGNAIIANKLQ